MDGPAGDPSGPVERASPRQAAGQGIAALGPHDALACPARQLALMSALLHMIATTNFFNRNVATRQRVGSWSGGLLHALPRRAGRRGPGVHSIW